MNHFKNEQKLRLYYPPLKKRSLMKSDWINRNVLILGVSERNGCHLAVIPDVLHAITNEENVLIYDTNGDLQLILQEALVQHHYQVLVIHEDDQFEPTFFPFQENHQALFIRGYGTNTTSKIRYLLESTYQYVTNAAESHYQMPTHLRIYLCPLESLTSISSLDFYVNCNRLRNFSVVLGMNDFSVINTIDDHFALPVILSASDTCIVFNADQINDQATNKHIQWLRDHVSPTEQQTRPRVFWLSSI